MKKILFLICCFASAVCYGQTVNEINANKVTINKTLEIRKVRIDSVKNDTNNMGPRSLMTAAAIRQFVLARLSGAGGSMPTLQQVYDQGHSINNLPIDNQDTTKWWLVMDDAGNLQKMQKGNKVLNFASEFELIRQSGGDTLRLRNSPFVWGNNFVHGTDENGVFGAWPMDFQRVLNGGGVLTKSNTITLQGTAQLTFLIPGTTGSGLYLGTNGITFFKGSSSFVTAFYCTPEFLQFAADRNGDAIGTTYFEVRPDSLKYKLPTGIWNVDSLQNSNDTAYKRPLVYNLLKKRIEYLQSWPLGGGSGSGVVSPGSANRLVFYDEAGTTVTELPAIAADRVVISTSEGLPTHSSITATELTALDNVTSNVQDQLNGKLATNGNGSGLTGLTKSQVGLSDVDNTSDATKNSASATLTNKNISGSANTLSNIPASALTGTIARARLDTTYDVTTKDSRKKLIDSLYALKTPVTLTDGATITQASYNARVVSGGNRTLAIPAPENGQTYTLVHIQDGTGGRKLTGPDGSTIALNHAANDSTLVILHRQNNGWFISSAVKTFGYYTPTITNVFTTDVITPYACKWTREGNEVTVTGYFQTTVTSTGVNAGVDLSLPIPSTFDSWDDLYGSGNATSVSDLTGSGLRITYQSSNARIFWKSLASGNDISFTLTYTVQ